MMLQRNGQIPNGTILHQMVHSTSTTTRTRGSRKKRTTSESSSSESECKFTGKLFFEIDVRIDLTIYNSDKLHLSFVYFFI